MDSKRTTYFYPSSISRNFIYSNIIFSIFDKRNASALVWGNKILLY